jgi:hypothetical protein
MNIENLLPFPNTFQTNNMDAETHDTKITIRKQNIRICYV